MNKEMLTVYWIGQEPTGPGKSPTLAQMPAYVDVVPLAFVGISPDFQSLDFGFLTQQNSAATIQGWIKEVRANGTRVLFSINTQQIADVPDPAAFARMVKATMAEWGVDGVDIDFEPPFESQTVLSVVSALRSTLGSGALLTAPIYSPWAYQGDFLHQFAQQLDYLTTMDYTPYPGFDYTISLYEQYAKLIGTPTAPAYDKLAIGVSCMSPGTPNCTPLSDVAKLTAWEPRGGRKQGMMLYTSSYDIESRTGQPDGTWTRTIEENLPWAATADAPAAEPAAV